MNYIKESRKKLGLSQSEFAKMLEVSQETISGWERGYRNMPKIYKREIERIMKSNET